MSSDDQQQHRNEASMDLLKKMGAWIDKQIEEAEEKQRLEDDWQSRRTKRTEEVEE